MGTFREAPWTRWTSVNLQDIQSSCSFLSSVCIVINPFYVYVCYQGSRMNFVSSHYPRTGRSVIYRFNADSNLWDGIKALSGHKEFILYPAQHGIHKEDIVNTASLYWWWDKITFLGCPSWHGIRQVMNTINLHSLGNQGRRNNTLLKARWKS